MYYDMEHNNDNDHTLNKNKLEPQEWIMERWFQVYRRILSMLQGTTEGPF